jgi:transposase
VGGLVNREALFPIIGEQAVAENENEGYEISDELWEKIMPLLPPDPPGNARSKMDKRRVMEAIFYAMRAGCEWENIPRNIGVGRIVHEYFLEWRKTGVFDRMWQSGILTHGELRALIWGRK